MTRLARYKLPKYVQAFVDRETGIAYHYFRRRGAPRIRLPGLPWSAEFMQAYQRTLEQHRPAKTGVPARGSIADVVASYVEGFDIDVHCVLSAGTRVTRRRLLQNFARAMGHKPIASVTADELTQMFESMSPGTAENLLKAIRGMMKWGVENGELKTDPSAGVKLKRRKSDGFHTWTEDEIAQFEFHHPVGSKARLAFALALYSGQRRGDIIRMGRQHIRDGWLHVKQQKTGKQLALPVLPELHEILEAAPSEHLTFLVNGWNKPFDPGGFSNWFRAQCDAAGLPKVCSVHGLRKAAARRFAEAGCTVHQIAAWTGHASLKEVERYTKAADQARLARSAMAVVIKARSKVSRKNEV
jgi:integrase